MIKELQQICDRYSDILGVVILFGSYSRDEANEKSDIDLYIEPKDANISTQRFGKSKRYKEFKYDLYDSFSTEFDLLSYGGVRDIQRIRRTPLWRQIQKEGVVVYDQRAEAV